MGYSAKAIANYFYKKGQKDKKPITPLKMQKLVYVAHGWHLGIEGQPLIDDEYVEAWELGPVFPSLYHEFKHLRSKPITEPAEELIIEDRLPWEHPLANLKIYTPKVKEEDKELINFLDQVWDVYSKYSGLRLSAMSHGEGTPWSKTRQKVGKIRNAPIDNKEIEKFYKAKLEK